ncbi:MAG: hypothetical protein EBZ96_10820 [Synechococcaceae bacterium WB9_3_282]|nr:hypothetical protein [Synechococcaceae bacterium WB9_3_282]
MKCDKLPTTNYGFFDVSRVVETLMAPTVPTLTQAGFADHAGFYSGYRLTFMEEYGSTPVVQTGTVTTVSGRVAFAGNLEQLELADWSGGVYFPGFITDGVSKALTTPTTRTVYGTDYGFLCMGQSGTPWDRVVVTYPTRSFNVTKSGLLSGSIVRFGAGPMNLKALTSGQCSDSQAGSVGFPTADGSSYTIAFEDSFAGNFSVYYTYTIGPCQRFNSQPVHFVNKYGGIDSYTFTLKNRKRANVQRDTFGYNTDVYGTLTYDKVWAGSFDYVYALNSDWLTDAESEWLIELVRSGQVWLELDGQLVEAVVNANSYQFVTRRNDQLQQLQIEIAVAYKNNIL